MASISFDAPGKHFYENGIEQVVLYIEDSTATSTHCYGTGIAWNGVTSLTESPQGADANPLYADDIKYLNLIANETFQATIEAYFSPKEFDACDGMAGFAGTSIAKMGQQTRKKFCLAYKTRIGNENGDVKDVTNEKWHFIYNCKASPASKDYSTVNDSPEAATLSWELNTTPLSGSDLTINSVTYLGGICTASVTYKDLPSAKQANWADLEKEIIGDANTNAHILFPAEIFTILNSTAD